MPLFEENIELFLNSEDGPVGQLINRKAEEVQALVQADVRKIMHRLPAHRLEEVVGEVQVQRNGANAVIGFVNTGQEVGQYLSHKAELEPDKLTLGALKTVFTK